MINYSFNLLFILLLCHIRFLSLAHTDNLTLRKRLGKKKFSLENKFYTDINITIYACYDAFTCCSAGTGRECFRNRKGRVGVTLSKGQFNMRLVSFPSSPAACYIRCPSYLTRFCKFFILQLWREKFPLQTTTVSNFQGSANAPSLLFALHLPELACIQTGPCNLS